jgi:hypothetical protein
MVVNFVIVAKWLVVFFGYISSGRKTAPTSLSELVVLSRSNLKKSQVRISERGTQIYGLIPRARSPSVCRTEFARAIALH